LDRHGSLAGHRGVAKRPGTWKQEYAPWFREDCSRGLLGVSLAVKQRRALGALFALLALALAGVAFAAGNGAGGQAGRWIIALAAAVLAVWLASMAFRALR
jgi:hypothetical protein